MLVTQYKPCSAKGSAAGESRIENPGSRPVLYQRLARLMSGGQVSGQLQKDMHALFV